MNAFYQWGGSPLARLILLGIFALLSRTLRVGVITAVEHSDTSREYHSVPYFEGKVSATFFHTTKGWKLLFNVV